MTKLVRRLKQKAKKKAHRKSVQKRKLERAQKVFEETERRKQEQLELEEGLEMQESMHEKNEGSVAVGDATLNKQLVRLVGGLVLDAPQRKTKKQMSRKQMKRKEKQRERGAAITAQLERKWDTKKRRVKQRAQIRNEDLHN